MNDRSERPGWGPEGGAIKVEGMWRRWRERVPVERRERGGGSFSTWFWW